MSKNINQIFIANPITTNVGTDLMYFGRSPYGVTNDTAMTYANFSAQFGSPYTAAALTEVNDTNVTLTLGGTPTAALLAATSITAGWAGQLSLTRGGTNASLTASAGSVAYSSASALALSAVGSSGQLFISNGTSAPGWTTSTYPTTNAINTLLYASSANVISALPTVTTAVLTTAVGVPTWATTLLPILGGTGVASPTIHGIMVAEGSSPMTSIVLSAGQILVGTTAGDPAATSIASGTGITVTNASGAITISSTGAQPWVDETGASVMMTANTGYTSDDGATLVTFTLPTTSAIGDFVEINGKGSGGWTIAQATGQQINNGTVATTSGSGGSLSSAHQYDCVRLRCLTANTIWTVASQQSSGLTVV